MRLGIVSDCVHFTAPDGRIGTETHILLQQLEALSLYYDKVVLCCPFTDYQSTFVASYYSILHLTVIPLPNVGGDTLKDKWQLFKTIPAWWKAFKKLDQQTDIVYQRFPNNLNIPGFFYFWLKRKKVFATYTGTWSSYRNEPITYALQRWLLSKLFRGPVWVYTDQAISDPSIHPGFSPSYKQVVWAEEAPQVELRLERLRNERLSSLRMITVGALVPNKNQQLILEACLELKKRNIAFNLTIVGGGILKDAYQQFIDTNGLGQNILLVGKKTADELRILYREHDLVVQAPLKEGFGKVPIEGFFHGLIPVLSDLPIARMMVQGGKRGFIFNGGDVLALVETLTEVIHYHGLAGIIENGRNYARTQTLEAWAGSYVQTVGKFYHI
ncbi:MAG: glycosyltransferase family 4 protein [Bacteroidota bacterium]|nr:glycosyltransferase family 4 protein [Bacteroidota bacterium]